MPFKITKFPLSNLLFYNRSEKFINLNTSVLSKKSEKGEENNDKVKNRKSAISYYKK
jgi:hypothetical protein